MPLYNGISAILAQDPSQLIFVFVAPLHKAITRKEKKMATTQKLAGPTNGVAVEQLLSTVEAVKATPSIAKFTFRIRNQWETGSRNCSIVTSFTGANQQLSHPRPFTLQADEPAILLGKDLAANPVEHLLHALASCVTTSMVYHAAARGIQIEQVESFFEGDLDLHGFLDLSPDVRKGYQQIRVRFKVRADAPDGKLQEIVELGTRHSPVFDSLTNGVPVFVSAEPL